MDRTRKKVVIVGGGFGGVYTAKNLKDFDITLINQENYFLFTPLLHEVATGNLSPASIIEPLSEIFRDQSVQIIRNKVTSVDLQFKNVSLKNTKEKIGFDYLVLATGSETKFTLTGAKEYAFGLKNISDAISLKNQVIENFEKASAINDIKERRRLLTFVIVGGGPTGIEYATELENLICGTLAKYYNQLIKKEEISIIILNSGPEILAKFDPRIRNSANDALHKMGIKISNDTSVKEIGKNFVATSDGQIINNGMTIMLSGVVPMTVPLGQNSDTENNSNRIPVDDFLRLKDYDNVFALGDSALFIQAQNTLPMLAQVATKQAKTVAQNIRRHSLGQQLIKFSYKSAGELISLGKFNASGVIMNRHISGFFAWWLWRTIYLFKFLSWKKRLTIMLEWTINLFSTRDISRLG